MPAHLRSAALAAALPTLLSSAAHAQIAFQDNGFSGEASVSGMGRTGNTESTDLGLSLKLRHETALWRNIFGATYDWGRADGVATKDRLASSYELARLLNDRLYAFGRTAYERDDFSGYDYRIVGGGGLGVDILTGKARTWSLQGGPAYRVDEVARVTDETGLVLTPRETQSSVAGNLGSRFFAQINDNVSFQNDTDFTASRDTTTIFNTSALTTKLMGSIQARFSFDVSHDTSPPFGAEPTDTTTRAALVYTFGR